MKIRQAVPDDHPLIYDLIETAFATARVADGTEQDFAEKLWNSDAYIPELDLVAEEDGNLVGHVMFTKTIVEQENGCFEALLLAPVSVLRSFRDQGIGASMIRAGQEKARNMGYKAVFLLGDPAYYRRFGFGPTFLYNIRCSLDLPEDHQENIMVCELLSGALEGVSGIVRM
ncbi:N-acetyltransferase [Eubacterium sp. 1001713B170207_170306_E7]|uniref:GNAT family N-acetyltransferase n=1 Tax=Eubacterium sp. 1001713B170207_170306_E7 TaxID=2787097 RepID=UPI00189A2018|nr:N-acetyltransferase [Eubacterium sp. 1001713B170207_170306_E7]